MNPRNIPLAIQRHYRRVRSLGRTVSETWGEKDIHQFRVEVKKLRAYLRLAAAARVGVKAGLPRKLHVFYSMMGVIRSLQLQQNGLEAAAVRVGMELPDTCSAFLEGRIETAITLAKLYLKLNSPFGNGRSQWHSPLHAYAAEKAIGVFVRQREDRMALPSGDVLPEEELHAMRKAMKDILYAWPCLFGSGRGYLLPGKWQSRADLRALTDLLGEFHDICIQQQLLQDSHFLLTADGQARAFLEAVRKLWRKDKEEKLEQLRHILSPSVETSGDNPLSPGHLNAESYELHVD